MRNGRSTSAVARVLPMGPQRHSCEAGAALLLPAPRAITASISASALDFQFDNLPLRTSALQAAQATGATNHVYSFTLDPIINIPVSSNLGRLRRVRPGLLTTVRANLMLPPLFPGRPAILFFSGGDTATTAACPSTVSFCTPAKMSSGITSAEGSRARSGRTSICTSSSDICTASTTTSPPTCVRLPLGSAGRYRCLRCPTLDCDLLIQDSFCRSRGRRSAAAVARTSWLLCFTETAIGDSCSADSTTLCFGASEQAGSVAAASPVSRNA